MIIHLSLLVTGYWEWAGGSARVLKAHRNCPNIRPELALFLPFLILLLTHLASQEEVKALLANAVTTQFPNTTHICCAGTYALGIWTNEQCFKNGRKRGRISSMLTKFLTLVVSSILVVYVQPQVNGAVSMSDCLLSCSTSSAESAGCSGITDQICVCTSTAFHDAVSLCLTSRCPTSDYQNAQALYQEEC
ncbi:hypothetical protein J3A83DRAFT_3473974 [Scleroderma citrinum]